MLRFESPWMLLLLVLIPLVVYLHERGKPGGTIRFSTIADVARAGRSIRQRLLVLPLIVRIAVLVLVVIALARPQMGTERILDTSRGIAIEMVIDRSSSMSAELRHRGQQINRLEVAIRLFEEFVTGGQGNLKGRLSDLIGLITFARYPDTICPLTLAHHAVTGFLPTVKLVQRESEDGTAIGDAVALAAARLQQAEEALTQQAGENKEYEIKSKVIILLTDGENNAGTRTIQEAADLAAAWDIKIYAIGIGGQSASTVRTPFGVYTMPMARGVDENALKILAETTGGMVRIADDAAALRSIYEEIDQLEKSEIETFRFLDYRELFTPFALAALGLLALEVLLSSTVLRRIP